MLLEGQQQQSQHVIFDVTTQDFEERVMMASMDVPVIVDFWAPWCGPCKQLMPILEKVVQGAGGKALLAKVNIDQNQELAAALRIQSVPTVYGFFQGRPVEAFQGAQAESKIREFVQKLIAIANSAKPNALDIPGALKDAAQFLSEGNAQGAYELYSAILHQDALCVEAYIGMVRCFIEIGQIEQAQGLVDNAPEEIAKAPSFAQAKTALELAQGISQSASDIEALKSNIRKDETDHQSRIDLAHALYVTGQKEQAAQTLLDSIALDAGWEEGAARKELLRILEAMGNSDPVAIAARRKLSSLLFS